MPFMGILPPPPHSSFCSNQSSTIVPKPQPISQQQSIPRTQQQPQQPGSSVPGSGAPLSSKIPEQTERPSTVELDPTKQQIKRTANPSLPPAPTATSVTSAHNLSNAEIQQQLARQHQQQTQVAMPEQARITGAVQPSRPSATPIGSSKPQSQTRVNAHVVIGGSVTTPTGQVGGQRLSIGPHGSLGIQSTQTQGGGAVGVAMAPGGVKIPGRGGGLLTTATPTSMLSNSLGNTVGLGGGGHMVSHDQADDSVFSPGIVDDERMKLLERVSLNILFTVNRNVLLMKYLHQKFEHTRITYVIKDYLELDCLSKNM